MLMLLSSLNSYFTLHTEAVIWVVCFQMQHLLLSVVFRERDWFTAIVKMPGASILLGKMLLCFRSCQTGKYLMFFGF